MTKALRWITRLVGTLALLGGLLFLVSGCKTPSERVTGAKSSVLQLLSALKSYQAEYGS